MSTGSLRSRWPAVVTVLVVAIGVGIVSAVFPTPAAAPAPGIGDGVPVSPVLSVSSSAFCAAPTRSAATSTIFLTNSSPLPVTAVMTSVQPTSGTAPAPSVRRRLSVPARGRLTVDPSAGLASGSVATSFLFDGGGVVADEVVSGSGGWSMAPCASRTASQWAFAGGSTNSGDSVNLALFDPAASEAVVDLSFMTGNGLVTPEAYQGLVVPSGQLVVETIGSYVQDDSDIGTVVTVESGAVVSTEFDQSAQNGGGGLSLRLGAPELSTVWRFAQTTVTPGGTVHFDVANPEDTTVTATLAVGLSTGTVAPRRVAVAPLSTSDVAVSGPQGFPQDVTVSAAVTASAPIVAGREVSAPSGASAPTWGASSGTITTATRWLVPAPGTPASPGTSGATVTSLAVADPGAAPAWVTVSVLGRKRALAAFLVVPGGVVVLGPGHVGGLESFSVVSTQPVIIEEDAGPSGAAGVVSSTGFPSVES